MKETFIGLKNVVKVCFKDVTLGVIFPFVYFCAAKTPIDERKVVFLESKQERLPDSFRVIYDTLHFDSHFDVYFLSLGRHRVSLVRYLKNCINALKEVATARCVFLCDASDVVSCVGMRADTDVVQLWHACGAFKKWGMSTANLEFGGSREQILRHPFYENLSLVTVSSPEVTWAYAEAMLLEDKPDVIQPLGVSRTDLFFDEGFLEAAERRVQSAIPQVQRKKVLLYAPTFRGHVSQAKGPGELDVSAFARAFKDEYVLLIKHHPFVKDAPELPEDCAGFAFDVSEELSIEDLLCVADVCITDYSSLIFEFSLFERPMVFFAYDRDEYDDWRGFYYNYDELTPGPVFTDNRAMIEYLQNVNQLFDVNKVKLFKERFMSSCDGRATERILKKVFGFEVATVLESEAE